MTSPSEAAQAAQTAHPDARARAALLLFDELVTAVADDVTARVTELLSSHTKEESWRLLTLDEAAGRPGRSTRWVRERVKSGALAHVWLDGGAFAFDVDDLRAFAEARKVAADAPALLAARLQVAGDPARANGSAEADRVGYRRVGR